jgi:hypothetical protein
MDAAKFEEDFGEEVLGRIGGTILDFDRDLFDFEDIFGKPGNFTGVEEEWIRVVGTNFWVEAFGVVGEIELVGISIGVAIDGGARSVEGFFYRINIHKSQDGGAV